MLLSDIILQSGQAALQFQLEDGSFPPGCNGPYHDPETSVRNTAHWLITMLKAFEISNDSRFKDSAWAAAEYLLSPSVRPMGATFLCRKDPEKDFCNGLIGQAWVIEALAIAGKILEESRYTELARNVFLIHPFDHKVGLWRRVNVDGSYNTFDMTFNHQLWFAAAGAMLGSKSDNSINIMINRFLDQALGSHLNIDKSGRIIHVILKPSTIFERFIKSIYFIRRSIYFIRRPISSYRKNKETANQIGKKEIGYHAFNMYAFSMLKPYTPEHPLWKSDKFLLTLEFMNKKEFINGLKDNIYGYPYNPPGFEVAFTIQEYSSFMSFKKSREWWVNQQLRRCYNLDEKMMNRSTEDKVTLAARLYEATRLKDMEIQIP